MSRQPSPQRKGISDQGKDFVDAARALGCDESEERFDEALKKVAAHKPPPPPQKDAETKKSKPAQ
jgi:hypothetical protein